MSEQSMADHEEHFDGGPEPRNPSEGELLYKAGRQMVEYEAKIEELEAVIVQLEARLAGNGCRDCGLLVEGSKRFCASCNKERMKQSQKRYRARNPVKVRTWKREWARRQRAKEVVDRSSLYDPELMAAVDKENAEDAAKQATRSLCALGTFLLGDGKSIDKDLCPCCGIHETVCPCVHEPGQTRCEMGGYDGG